MSSLITAAGIETVDCRELTQRLSSDSFFYLHRTCRAARSRFNSCAIPLAHPLTRSLLDPEPLISFLSLFLFSGPFYSSRRFASCREAQTVEGGLGGRGGGRLSASTCFSDGLAGTLNLQITCRPLVRNPPVENARQKVSRKGSVSCAGAA